MSESSFHSSNSSSWIKSTSMNDLVKPSMSTSTASSTSERWRHSAQRRQQSQQERMRQLQDLEQQVADAATWNKRRTDLVTPPQQRTRHFEDTQDRFLDSPPAERTRKSIDLRDASLEDLESLIAASAKRLANHRLKRMSELGRPLAEHGNGISDLLDADDTDIRRTDKRHVFIEDPPQPSASKRSSRHSTHHKNVLEQFDPLNGTADHKPEKPTAALSQAPPLVPAQSHLRSMGEAKERRRPTDLNVDLLHSSSSPRSPAQPVHTDSSPKTPTRLPTPRTNSSSALPRFSLPAGPSSSSTSSRRMRTFSSVSKETELWMASKGKPSYSTRLADTQRSQPRTPIRDEPPSFASSTAASLRKSTSGLNVSRPTRTRTVSLMSASTPMHPKTRKELAEFDPLAEPPKRTTTTAPRARVVSMTTGAAREHTPLDLSNLRRTRMSQSNLKTKPAANVDTTANANGSGSGPRESQSMSTASSSSGRKRGKVSTREMTETEREREA